MIYYFISNFLLCGKQLLHMTLFLIDDGRYGVDELWWPRTQERTCTNGLIRHREQQSHMSNLERTTKYPLHLASNRSGHEA